MAPAHHQRAGERPQRVGVRRRRLRRHELDRLLNSASSARRDCRSHGGTPRGAHEGAPHGGSSSPTSSMARRPSSTSRAARPISLASSAVQVQSSTRSRPARSAAPGTGPERERPLEMSERSARPKTASAWRRFDRGDERFCGSSGGGPMRGRSLRPPLRCGRASSARRACRSSCSPGRIARRSPQPRAWRKRKIPPA